jgi:hypothetical protein
MATDTPFFKMLDGVKAELKGLKGEGLEVVDFAIGTLTGTPVAEAVFWVVLGGAQESRVPQRCLGEAKLQLFKKSFPTQASFCESLAFQVQRHVDYFSREGLVVKVGFESYSRVQEEGPLSYFR